MAATSQVLEVEGKQVRVNNLDKVLVPASGTRNADILDYYVKVSRFLLPHLEDRPLTLKLFIDGFGAPMRYLKNAPPYTPKWVRIAPMPRKGGGSAIRFVLVNDLPTLLWTAALSNLEMHTLLARAPRLENPTMMVFDLDPGASAAISLAASVALRLRDALHIFDMEAFVKSSGSKGIHVLVPLNTRVDYDSTQNFARSIAEQLERESPETVTTTMAKSERKGKIFIDYSQNAAHKSTACVYSLRATDRGAFVSIPLDWAMLEKGAPSRDEVFPAPERALEWIAKTGDLFAPVLKLRQKLPALRGAATSRPKRQRQKV